LRSHANRGGSDRCPAKASNLVISPLQASTKFLVCFTSKLSWNWTMFVFHKEFGLIWISIKIFGALL